MWTFTFRTSLNAQILYMKTKAGDTGPLWITVPTKLFHNGVIMTWSVMCTCTTSFTWRWWCSNIVALFGSSFPFSSCCFYTGSRNIYRNQKIMPWHQECLSVQSKFWRFQRWPDSSQYPKPWHANQKQSSPISPNPIGNPKELRKGVCWWAESRNIPRWKVANPANSQTLWSAILFPTGPGLYLPLQNALR